MNKHLLSILALALAAAACEKQGNDPGTQTPVQGKIIKVPIEISSPATRSHLGKRTGEERVVEWSPDDVIGLWDGKEVSSLKFTNNDNKFTGKINASDTENKYANIGKGYALTDKFYGIYPAGATYENSNFKLTLPTAQTAKPDSFAEGANIAVAQGTPQSNLVMSFKNAVSYLKVHVGNDLKGEITSLSIHGNQNHNLTGSVTVNPSAESPAVTGGSSTGVSLNGSIEGGNDYYLCVIPQDQVEIRLDFVYGEKAYSLKSSSPTNLIVGEVKYIANIDEAFIEKNTATATTQITGTKEVKSKVTYILVDSDDNMFELEFKQQESNSRMSVFINGVLLFAGNHNLEKIVVVEESGKYFLYASRESTKYFICKKSDGTFELKTTSNYPPSEATATRFKAVYKI